MLFFYHNTTDTFDSLNKPNPYSHSHQHHEIIQLLEGDVEFIIGSEIYHLQTGDLLLIRAGSYHTRKLNSNIYKRRVIEFEEPYLQISSNISKELLLPYNKDNQDFNPLIPSQSVKKYHLDSLFDKIEDLIIDSNKSKDFIPIHIMSLLVEFNNIFVSNPQKTNIYTIHSITEIIKYIDNNISRKITLNDLEKAVNLSKYYISHLFKETMGISIFNYIIERKIRHAEYLIRQGVQPTQASMMVGYYNYSNFYENYKKITRTKPKDTTIMINMEIKQFTDILNKDIN